MANLRKLAVLAAMILRLVDDYLADARFRQARRHRPRWHRPGLPADPVRYVRHYGLYPLREVPRYRPTGIRRNVSSPTWPGRTSKHRPSDDR